MIVNKRKVIGLKVFFWVIALLFWGLFHAPRTFDISILSMTTFYQFYLLVPAFYGYEKYIHPYLINLNNQWFTVLGITFSVLILVLIKYQMDHTVWYFFSHILGVSVTKLIYEGGDIFRKISPVLEYYMLIFISGILFHKRFLSQEKTVSKNITHSSSLYFKVNKQLKKVILNDIIYIEGLKDYVKIILDEDTVVVKKTMIYMQEQLPNKQFIRVQKSFIVNIDKIEKITGNLIQLKNKDIPIGNTYREKFFDSIQDKVF